MVAFAWLLLPFYVVSAETPPEPEKATEVHGSTVPSGFAELIPKAADLSQRLAQMKRQIAEITVPGADAPEFVRLENRLDALSRELVALKQAVGLNYERLVRFRQSVEVVNEALSAHRQPLLAGLRKLDIWHGQWQEDQAYWTTWKTAAGTAMTLPLVAQTFKRAMQTIDNALSIVMVQMKHLMTVQKRVFDIQTGINTILVDVEPMIRGARGEFLQDFSPPMYSSAFYQRVNAWLFFDIIAGVKRLLVFQKDYFSRIGWAIGLQVVLLVVVAVGIRRSGVILEGIDALRFMRRNPYAVGSLISAIALWNAYQPMPVAWELVLTAMILFTTARLVGSITAVRRRVMMMYLLAAVLLVTRIFIGIGLPMPLFRLYLLATTIGVGSLCIRFILRPVTARRTRGYTALLTLASLACLAIAIFEITGYSALSQHIFQSSMATIFIVVLARLIMLLIRGLLESAFRSPAVQQIPFLPAHTTKIIDRITKGFSLIVLLFCVGVVLQTWRVFTSPVEPIYRLLAFGVTVGQTRITIGLVLAAGACLYGALLSSRLIQLFLMRDVFARKKLDPGIGLSISRLLHYTIVLVGVMLALATLGFELTNLTIIASALSVGIGFGLQTIVNNFVCGLILLFERPVKVGDIIQLGSQWATIRDIGLRATIIQTFDRSDIVVPNSDLITNQLTNWTLDDRNMRIILTVGVAYGSDVPLVLKTLKHCTAENPRILNDPSPLIYFMDFGDSSLNFQIRVWIDDIYYMNDVRSELNQAIDRSFRELGVEVPFPQRDLHLRSVAPAAAPVLDAGRRAP
ncbi:hypothetical protein DSCO28_42640 [Desulfosarcina ovata subsp. sediminis]|uniref:Mechanosensitive ion channel protein n=2 Tax=Desulfosarcina ovata TaxID=83564 RepID=A0A5K7ZU19_9BACT|nr:hypothetical protein DSCO28_42640 [Desulfosarcina ovata subsp. sediminis]